MAVVVSERKLNSRVVARSVLWWGGPSDLARGRLRPAPAQPVTLALAHSRVQRYDSLLISS